MKLPIRALNEQGVERFREWIESQPSTPAPFPLLTDASTSETVVGAGEIENRPFNSRFELGEYLYLALENSRPGVSLPSYAGLWSWLTLFYIDRICPINGAGTRRVRGIDLYIPNDSFHRYYRHLIRTAVLMVKQYGALARIVLASSDSGITHSKFTEDLTARRDLLSNPRLIEVAGHLYFDDAKQTLKRGASSARGNVRRFIKILTQFDVNYDLYGDEVSAGQIVGLLPAEFLHWRVPRYQTPRP